MNEETQEMPIDALIQDNRLHILKAALPYLQLSGQRPLSIYVKYLELKNTMQLFQSDEETLSACALQKKDGNILDLLQDIRRYCPPDRQEAIDQILNFANMYQMYQRYQSMMQDMNLQELNLPNIRMPGSDADENAGGNGGGPNAAAVAQLKSMLSPEQRSIFETYLAANDSN